MLSMIKSGAVYALTVRRTGMLGACALCMQCADDTLVNPMAPSKPPVRLPKPFAHHACATLAGTTGCCWRCAHICSAAVPQHASAHHTQSQNHAVLLT